MKYNIAFIVGMICMTCLIITYKGITIKICTPEKSEIVHKISFDSYAGRNHVVLEQKHSGSMRNY